MSTGTATISSSLRRRGGPASAWLYPVALILGFSALAGLVPSAILREGLPVVFLAVVALASATNLIFARVAPATADRAYGDFVVVALVAVSLTGVYWFRAAMGITGWDGFGFGILITLGWWLPAVAFAALYRHPGERWLAQGRGRFLARVSVAVVASLAGLPIQGVLQEQHALHVERAGLPQAAPVHVVWRDGQWGPGGNHVALCPWQVGALSAAGLRVYLLEVSPEGQVRLFLEPTGTHSGVPTEVTLLPGESIAWEGIHLRHLGW